jgi:hypothetical protein
LRNDVDAGLHASPRFGCGRLVISKLAKVGDRQAALRERREVSGLVSESQLLNDSKVWGAETESGPRAAGDLEIENGEMATSQVVT